MPEEKPWAGPKEANSVPTGLALSVEVFEFEMTDYLRKRIGSVNLSHDCHATVTLLQDSGDLPSCSNAVMCSCKATFTLIMIKSRRWTYVDLWCLARRSKRQPSHRGPQPEHFYCASINTEYTLKLQLLFNCF